MSAAISGGFGSLQALPSCVAGHTLAVRKARTKIISPNHVYKAQKWVITVTEIGRRGVVRDAVGVGAATGAYGVSFGAIAVAAGLSVPETCALSALMFTGASQFAFVSVVAAGGGPAASVATALLLGARNALYGLRLSPLLRLRGARRLVGAQLVIDESTAMALAHEGDGGATLGFWSTGLAVFVLWNLGTLLGAVGAQAVADPRVYGLDAAVAAAFVALLAPRLTGGTAWIVAAGAAAVALITTPLVAPGVPVLCAAAVAVLALRRGPDADDEAA